MIVVFPVVDRTSVWRLESREPTFLCNLQRISSVWGNLEQLPDSETVAGEVDPFSVPRPTRHGRLEVPVRDLSRCSTHRGDYKDVAVISGTRIEHNEFAICRNSPQAEVLHRGETRSPDFCLRIPRAAPDHRLVESQASSLTVLN